MKLDFHDPSFPSGTNWGCSETRIMLETAETGILAFLQTGRRF